jgi:hypothetical protein
LVKKTSDEKRVTPKMQGAKEKRRFLMKKEAPLKRKWIRKTNDLR